MRAWDDTQLHTIVPAHHETSAQPDLCRHDHDAWSELHLRKSLGWGWLAGGKAEGGAATYAAVALLNVREVDEEGDVIHVDTAVDRVGEETRGILPP